MHGQPFLRQSVASTFQWKPAYRWFVQRACFRGLNNSVPGMAIKIPGSPIIDRHQPGIMIAMVAES
jgi:hypothetical protein